MTIKKKAVTERKVFDLIVLGLGSAGQRAAMQAAKIGKRVAIVEKYDEFSAVGDRCVHLGTLASKSFRESVYRYSMSSQGVLGQEADSTEVSDGLVELSEGAVDKPKKRRTTKSKTKLLPEMKRLLKRRDRVVNGEQQVISDQLQRNHIQLIQGHACFISQTEIEVVSTSARSSSSTGSKKKSNLILSAPFVFIAVGTRPVAPAHITIDGRLVHDSNTILTLREVPRSMVVLGAGTIGCEYASLFAMAGTHVTLVDKRNEILASVDREIVGHLMERFTHQGMSIILDCEAKKIERKSARGEKSACVRLHLSNGEVLQADVVLVAQERFGSTDALGLEQVGVKRDEFGLIPVDENYRTNVPTIYAMGDVAIGAVISSPILAATLPEQGRSASCHAFGVASAARAQLKDVFPCGISTIPEISMIGKSEEQLITEKVPYIAGKARYRELASGQIVGDRWGMLKLLVHKQTLKILGVHIIGEAAADLIHIGQAVMNLDGDVNYFIRSVFNYPTLTEAYKTAAYHAVNQMNGRTNSK